MSARTETETETAGVQHPDGIRRGTDVLGGRYLSVAEAAEELGIGYTAAWQAVARGRMLPTRIGGHTLIPAAEVAHYRDTRRASRGHTADELAAQRRAAAKTQAPKALTEWKRLRINYRLVGGRLVLLNVTQATVLSILSDSVSGDVEGAVVDHAYRALDGELTRARVVTLIARLIQYGLVQPLAHRDDLGGEVRVLRLGVNGRAALRYCRDRGLI